VLSHPGEPQFNIVIPGHKSHMASGRFNKIAQRLEETVMSSYDLLQLFQARRDIAHSPCIERGRYQKIETITIDDEFYFVGVSHWPGTARSSRKPFKGRLLYITKRHREYHDHRRGEDHSISTLYWT